MARRPDTPCSECGTLLWSSVDYPPGTPGRVCHPCRRSRPRRKPKASTVEAWRRRNALDPSARDTCADEGCDRAPFARGLCPSHYSYWYRREHGRKRPTYEIVCAFCGTEAIVSGPTVSCCSVQCGVRLNAGWSRSTDLAVFVPPEVDPPPPPPERKPWTWFAGSCVRCGESWVIPHQAENRYCSTRCADADAKDRRRARKRDAFVDVVYRRRIFERDGWRCQLCRKAVARAKAVPHPRAPTLDHIIPLADGGTHEPSNVQLACFACNCIKGDRYANDQLRLIG